ncbi:MAG: histidine kinase dimerization/phospho-acceptor domain-containing protein [Anaerolineales bacterium]
MTLKTEAPDKSGGIISTIRGKLMLTHVFVILFTMIVSAFLLLTLLDNYFEDALEENLKTQAHLIIEAILHGNMPDSPTFEQQAAIDTINQQQLENLTVQIGGGDADLSDPIILNLSSDEAIEALSQTTFEISSLIDSHVRIIDQTGTIVVDSKNLELGENLFSLPAISSALEGHTSTTYDELGGESWLFVTTPFLVEDQITGVLHIGQARRGSAALLEDLYIRWLLAAAIAVPVSILLSLFISSSLSKPVIALTEAANELSRGQFSYPLPDPRNDEIGQLSLAFMKMRDQIQAEEDLRTQFVSDVSHELRTPLTGIKGLVETLLDGAMEDVEVRHRFLHSIESETDRLIRLVNDLLILTRMDAQALHLDQVELELNKLLSTAVNHMKPLAEKKGITLVNKSGTIPLMVFVDRDRIEQVILILLDNAICHSPRGSIVHLTCEGFSYREGRLSEGLSPTVDYLKRLETNPEEIQDGGWVLIAINDSGEGLAEKDLPHVFDRFYRSDKARSRDRGGSGLGLSIAKGLVEAHRGQIWIDSPSPLQLREDYPGSAACVVLPAS